MGGRRPSASDDEASAGRAPGPTPHPVPAAGDWVVGATGVSRESLAPLAAEWHRLEEWPGTAVLKSNPSRDVLRLPSEEGRPSLAVKRYRVRGRAERWKYRFLPSRAAREWRALRELHAAALPVPQPVGFFESREGGTLLGSGLVMEFLEGVEPLPSLVTGGAIPEEEKAARLRAIGAIVARVHERGISHPDLHLGNFLGRQAEPLDVRLLDLHAVRHLGTVRPGRRRRDLGKLVHSLGEEVGPERIAPLVEAYLDGSREAGLGTPSEEVSRILEAAREVERVRLRSRDRRCWKSTSQFSREERGRWRIHRRRSFPEEAVSALIAGEAESLRTFVDRAGHTVREVRLPGARTGHRWIVKERSRGGLRSLLDRCHRGPLERGWAAARQLEVRGLPHPPAQALLIERPLARVTRTILVTEALPGRTLAEEVRSRRDDPRGLSLFLARAADTIAPLLRALHRSRIHHRDLNPSNWLILRDAAGGEGAGEMAGEAGSGVDPDPVRVAILDLDSIHPRRDATLRRRRGNLVQLALLPDGICPPRLRARFLLRYHAGERIHSSWLRSLDRELARRQIEEIEKRIAREITATRDGTER